MSRAVLVPINNALWHEYFRGYVADPMMTETPYVYDHSKCEDYFRKMMADATRRYFAIVVDGKVVGQIYLKHIDWHGKTSSFGIALIDDSVKGKGYGTKAIQLLFDYAFDSLGLETIYADTVLGNVRSQYVLKKLGFIHVRDDANFSFYKIRRGDLGSPDFPEGGI